MMLLTATAPPLLRLIRIRRGIGFLTWLLFLLLPTELCLAGPGATDSSVATVMNLDYNSINNKATVYTIAETDNYGIVSSPPLYFGNATSSTIKDPRPKCDKPIDFDVIAEPSNLTQHVHVDPFCTKYSGGDIAVLAVEVGGGVCGYDQTKLLVQTFTDYGCNDDNKHKRNDNININNVQCRKQFVWKTRQVIFVDLLSSLPGDDPSPVVVDKYRPPVCNPTNITSIDINQTQIQWINEPIPGEIVSLRIVNYTNSTTTTTTSSGGQEQQDDGDDDVVIVEKQLSDLDGVSFLILIRDPITGEILLLETPKAGGDELHKGIWFSLVISAAVIGFGVCLCWGCCCVEYRRYINELHENREKSKALNNNDNNNNNDNDIIGENRIDNNEEEEEEDSSDDVEEPTQPQQQQVKQQQKQQSDTEITYGVDTTATTTTTSFVKESESLSSQNHGSPDDDNVDDDDDGDDDEKVSVEETV